MAYTDKQQENKNEEEKKMVVKEAKYMLCILEDLKLAQLKFQGKMMQGKNFSFHLLRVKEYKVFKPKHVTENWNLAFEAFRMVIFAAFVNRWDEGEWQRWWGDEEF